MHRLRHVVAVFLFVACLCSCAGVKKVVIAQPPALPVPSQVVASPQQQLRLPFDTGPASASDPIATTVNYAWPLQTLCAASGCAKIDTEILDAIGSAEKCPESRCGGGNTPIAFRLVKPASTTVGGHLRDADGNDLGIMMVVGHGSLDDAADLIRSMGLRPATARELLVFAGAHKDRFRSGTEIVALGTPFFDNDGIVHYAVAYCDDGGTVRAMTTFLGPDERTVFLAAPK